MKTYLFVYANSLGDREKVKAILCSMQEVSHWRYDMPNSFYIRSDSSAQELVEAIVGKVGSGVKRFIITEISDNRQGYLPRETWNFIKGINKD